MADGIEGRRPKRRCVSTKSALPSAIHYVGYVEEDETPEMIMKKFEELEKVVINGMPGLVQAQQPRSEPGRPCIKFTSTHAHGGYSQVVAAGGSSKAAPAAKEADEWDTDPEEEEGDAAEQAEPAGQDAAEAGPLGAGSQEGLTEEQLMEVFKQTSIFNVRSALANNDALLGAPGLHGPDER
jgi:hypothetical protein